MAQFQSALTKTLKLEGGFSDDPADLGGKTNYGITEVTARKYGYTGDMRQIPFDLVKKIYKTGYWDACRLDELESQLIAENIFDCAVNCGVGTAARLLQESLNSLNVDNVTGKNLWPDITVDGTIGNQTVSATNNAIKYKTRETAIIKVFNCLRGAYFVRDCTQKRTVNKKFMLGWTLHRIWLEVRK